MLSRSGSTLRLPVDEVEKTVLHEVAHFWLGHKPSFAFSGQTAEDSDRQETEADEQAMQWLSSSTDATPTL